MSDLVEVFIDTKIGRIDVYHYGDHLGSVRIPKGKTTTVTLNKECLAVKKPEGENEWD